MSNESWLDKPEGRVLLEVFASNSEDQLQRHGRTKICSAFGIPEALYSELSRNKNYATAYSNISEIRKRVDDVLRRRSAPDALQVALALALLKGYRRRHAFPEFQACYRILQGAAYVHWPPEQKALFVKNVLTLRLSDYFLSYTNRMAAETNHHFRKAFLGMTAQLAKNPRTTINLIAAEIARRFTLHNLKGFYDMDDIQLGDEVRARITQGAAESIVFVQVVERALFEQPPMGTVNWCFTEFQSYEGSPVANRFAFLIGARLQPCPIPVEALRPAVLPLGYDGWLEKMQAHKAEILENSAGKLQDQLDVVATKVMTMIEATLDTITSEEFVYGRDTASR